MANYTGIQGQNILIVSSDPSNPVEGQIWYNTTSQTLKGYQIAAINAWATGGNMNTSRYGAAGFAPKTASLIFGGNTLPFDTPSAATESYNGTSWTTVNSLNTARYYAAGFGTQTAATAVGGDSRPPGSGNQTTTEDWNGTSWTTGTAYPVATSVASGAGTQTAGLVFGGGSAPGTRINTTNKYNGSTWTSTGNLNTIISWSGGGGTQTAAISFGGISNPTSWPTATELFNGTSWVVGPSMGQARQTYSGGGGGNIQTSTLAAGGYNATQSPGFYNNVEGYNGTAWSSFTPISTTRGYGTGGGTTSSGILVGAFDGTSLTAATEEWTGAVLATRTITTS
jgi:hypothetical protein